MGKHSFIRVADVALSGVAPGRSARYVGRVGALAVALGVGVAVAVMPGMPGIAGATPGSETGSDTNTSANDNDTAANDNDPGGADDVTPGDDEAEPGDDEDAADDEVKAEEEDADDDDVEVIEEVVPDEEEQLEVELELESSDSEPPLVVPDPVVPEVIVDPVIVERPTGLREQFTPQQVITSDAPAPLVVDSPKQEPAPETPPVQLLLVGEGDGAAASQLRTFDSFAPPSLTVPVAPQPAAAPFSFISTVVSALVVPLLAPVGPISPAQTPVLFAVLAWVRRQFEHSFANQAPVLVDNQDTELVDEDTVTGSVTGTDADPEDTVTYGHSGGNPNAAISVDQNGNWTYSAPESWDGTTEYTDSFTITATDEDNSPSHLHGFLSLFAPDRGHTASQVITVTIPPAADTNTPPDVTVSDPGDPDPETGAVTFTVTARDDDGDPLTVTASNGAQVTAPVYDAASDSYVYTVTYTPDPQDRLDAYSSAGEDVVPVTVLVDDGVNDPVSETVSLTIDPVAAVATPGATQTVPAGSPLTGATTGADGTVAVTNYGPSGTTITVLRPGSSTPDTATVVGFPAGAPQVGEDGTVAVTTRTGSGTAADPSVTTVTIMRPGDPTPETVTVPDASIGTVVGADGTVAITSLAGSGTADDPHETTVTVLRPGASAPVTETVDGVPIGSATVGADGTVALATQTAADPYSTTITVLRPGQAEPVSHTVTGSQAAGPPVVGADGTVAQLSRRLPDSAADPGETVLTILRPGVADVDTAIVSGGPYALPVVGVDGTTALTTFILGPAGELGVTTLTVLRPNDPAPATATTDGYPTLAPQVGADGTVVQTASTGTESTVIVLRPGESTPTFHTAPGGGAAQVGADGTVAHTTFSDANLTTVTVLRPSEPADTATVAGLPVGAAPVGADGTGALTTKTGTGTVADPYVTTVTVLRPGDSPVSATFVGNPGSRQAQVGRDGTVVLTTTPGSTGADQTTVTMLRPDDEPLSQSVDGSPIVGAPAVLNEDGTVTLSTIRGSGSAADPFVFTQYTITFADTPVSMVV